MQNAPVLGKLGEEWVALSLHVFAIYCESAVISSVLKNTCLKKKKTVEFVTVLLLFYSLIFFGCKAYGILAPQPGIEPLPPALEG